MAIDVGSLIGGISQAHNSLVNTANFGLQLSNYNYQKRLQQQIFAREDNAYSRAARDLEAAGLSKTLAAGSPAQAGTAIKTEAAQLANEDISSILMGIQLDQMLKESDSRIEATRVNNDYIRDLAAKARRETSLIDTTEERMHTSMSTEKLGRLHTKSQIAGMQIEQRNRQDVIDSEIMQRQAQTQSTRLHNLNYQRMIDKSIEEIDANISRIAAQNRLSNAQVSQINHEIVRVTEETERIREQINLLRRQGRGEELDQMEKRISLLQTWHQMLIDTKFGGQPRSVYGKMARDLQQTYYEIFTTSGRQWAERMLREMQDASDRFYSH